MDASWNSQQEGSWDYTHGQVSSPDIQQMLKTYTYCMSLCTLNFRYQFDVIYFVHCSTNKQTPVQCPPYRGSCPGSDAQMFRIHDYQAKNTMQGVNYTCIGLASSATMSA